MGSDAPLRVRKRRRPAYSCIECRRRKVRCDRATPCGQCKAFNAPSCTYAERRPHISPNAAEHPGESEPCQGTSEQAAQPGNTLPTAPARMHGALNKTRVYGYGHWMNSMSMVDELPGLKPLLDCYQSFFHDNAGDKHDSAATTIAECKRLAQEAKRQRPSRKRLPDHVYGSLPECAVIGSLVQLYFTTFESCYRILYYPSFIEEYGKHKDSLENADTTLVVELLLIMSATGALHAEAHIRDELATKSPDWILIAQTWLSAPLEKDRLTLKGIQIHCLILLARHVTRLGADLVWISAGSLMRMAMQMGLHLDPSCKEEMSLRDADIRRRLWYTILEMNVQAALDSGMSPIISVGDFSTLPPSKRSDEELEKGPGQTESQCEMHEPTSQKQLLPVLAESLPLRLAVTKVINSLQEKPLYEEVLRLGKELATACHNATTALECTSPLNSTSQTSQFVLSHFTHLLRRFTLCLHFPYAIQARNNPAYTYSLKQCLDATLDIVSLLDDKLYTHLLLTGGGMFRDLITRGAFVLYLELTSDVDTLASLVSRSRSRLRQASILRDAQRVARYAKERMFHGETSVKGYVFICMATAQMEALFDGSPAVELVMNAARESLETCRGILGAMARKELSVRTNPGTSNVVASPSGDLDGQFDFFDDETWDFDFGQLLGLQQSGDVTSLMSL